MKYISALLFSLIFWIIYAAHTESDLAERNKIVVGGMFLTTVAILAIYLWSLK